MGLRLTVPNADFSGAAIGFSPPVTTGLLYWNYFTAGNIARNLAVGQGAPGVFNGTPAQGSGYATFSGTEYVDTGIADMAEETMLLVARWGGSLSNNSAMGDFGASALNGTRSTGAGMIFTTNSGLSVVTQTTGRYHVSDDTTSSDTESITTSASVFSFWSGTANDSATSFQNWTTNQSAGGAKSDPRDPSTRTIRIGSGNNLTTSCDVAFAAVYSGVLSPAQIASLYSVVKTYLNTLSISI